MNKKRGVREQKPAGGRRGERAGRSFAELLRLPQDVVCGDTVICMLGKTRVKIENYRSILIYSDTMIKLQTKANQVEISGKQLRIRYYDKDEMEITGRIDGVRFG